MRKKLSFPRRRESTVYRRGKKSAINYVHLLSSDFIESRSQELVKLGFSGYDATHIASAERSNADVFLSTDDRLINRANRNIKTINVAINNPVQWLMTVNLK